VTKLEIALLADHAEAVDVLAGWFAHEWGAGG
jgi:hypothetical protein